MYRNATGIRQTQRAVFVIVVLCMVSFIARAGLWSTGYYPGWEQASLPPANIDFAALTHIIHFSVVPNSNGTLNSSANSIALANSTDLISQAHAAGTKVLICVGGASSESGFQSATTPANLPTFITSLTNFMDARGYDGVDIDWEPLPTTDAQQYTNLVNGLRAALNVFPQHKLLTAAVGAYPPFSDPATSEYVMFASLQNQFDQINIMTYDLSGPYGGWVTWFNSPIFDGGYRFPSTGGLVPSVDGAVKGFLGSGVSSNKLGIGIAFYGYIWSGGTGTTTGGVTQPRQSWINAPTVSTPAYNTIMASYYQTNLYHWDTSAQAAYIGISNASPANDKFISYDDQRTCQAKVSYVRNHGLGGVMIWEIAQDHQSGQVDPLLLAIKQALASPGPITIQSTNQDITLTFNGIALGSYRVQWTDSLISNVWNTLAVTNVSGPGQPLQILDPNPFVWPQRFYRVQSPQ
jgi:chitinase